MEVLRNWLERARRYGVREPRALALATVDGQGRPSTRIVVIAELGERGVVFATHADSQKGRELAQNPWASGCCTGARAASRSSSTAEPNAPDERPTSGTARTRPTCDRLARAPSRHPRPARRSPADDARCAPPGYCLFELCLESVEFWGNGTERLHERLRYDRDEGGWKHRYLQP